MNDDHRNPAPGSLEAPESIRVREAGEADLERIVQLLADDPLGVQRERYEVPLPQEYVAAFQAIRQDPNNEVVVACVRDEVVGVLQLTFIPGLSRSGAWRCQVEGVRVDARFRSLGVGKRLMERGVSRAQERGCRIVQLTTDKLRPEALRFYERLGFVASHIGLKLDISGSG